MKYSDHFSSPLGRNLSKLCFSCSKPGKYFLIQTDDAKEEKQKPDASFDQNIPNAFVGCWVEEANEENMYSLSFLSVQGVVSVHYNLLASRDVLIVPSKIKSLIKP